MDIINWHFQQSTKMWCIKTKSVKQSHSWETDSYLTGQEIHLLWTLEVPYSPPLDPILSSHLNPVHTLKSHFFNTHFNISLSLPLNKIFCMTWLKLQCRMIILWHKHLCFTAPLHTKFIFDLPWGGGGGAWCWEVLILWAWRLRWG
jgi:hypothetical protein